MVKLGFIVEGDTEKILLESEGFKKLLTSYNLDFIPDILNAGGNGNLLPNNIIQFTQILVSKGANKIIILTDLDKDKYVTETKNRISPLVDQICIVSKKQIEARFLADTLALSNFLKSNNFSFTEPELFDEPFEEIKNIRMKLNNGRGIGDKKILANYMVKNNFSFERAASHPNCSSANYFLN